ncbi:MAG: ABC-F family ATP-binding cassette domain-containing protein [Myxococcota bacterium]|nr:ABC-F family ATP-binding cassette domain-containing protein [Myxococcota bacterium]
MSVLDAQQLTRTYGVRTVLGGVSLTLTEADRVGLVGANGSGKSTLGRILAGVEEPDSGQVVSRRDARVGYLPQEPVFEGDPTAREAALSGLTRWMEAKEAHDAISAKLAVGQGDTEALLEQQAEAGARIEQLGGWDRTHAAEAMLDKLGVRDHGQRVSSMSGGERRRVDLARLLVSRPDVAILDEPTNHLDVDTIEWLEGHLQHEQPGALLLITHDRFFLDRVVKRTAELSGGELRIYEGGYEAYLEAKAEREAFEQRVEKNRQNFLRRELDWLRRQAPARTSKQKARTDRANAALAQDGPRSRKDVALHVETVRTGKTVLELEELRLEVPGRTLVEGLTLTLAPGERVGIVGPNGSGKTTLLRAVLGEHEPAGGKVTLGQNARITYFGQAREGLDEDATVLENVAGGRQRVTVGERTMDARGYLERFLFDYEQQVQPVRVLSGGEKARCLLAKLLLTPANLLILDEPTNDLDVPTLAALEEMLVELNGTALVVTHDRWFLDRVATATLAFEGDGRVVRYPGGYTTYKALRGEEAAQVEKAEKVEKKERAPKPKKKGLTYGERLELEGIMDVIAAAEEKVGALETRLADPALYEGGGDEAATLSRELEAAKAELDAKVARWEALETKKAMD